MMHTLETIVIALLSLHAFLSITHIIVDLYKFKKMDKFVACAIKRVNHLCSPVKLNSSWRPEMHQDFYYLGSAGTVCHDIWHGSEMDDQVRAFMGIYPTEEEAITAREGIIRELQQLHVGEEK